jgi:CheY-like chemotaxis protein
MRRARTRGVAVLIVADDPVAREVYAELFASRGHVVATACGAREGIASVARRRDIGIAVVALATGAGPLRRRLRAIAPGLRVHVLGLLLPLRFGLRPPTASRLH